MEIMIRNKSVQYNSVLNVIKTFATLIFPVITYPYVLRILGAEQIGEYSYSKSIVNYFVLIAGLGISRYAIREGARKRDSKEELEKFAGQMLFINIVSTIIAYALLVMIMFFSNSLSTYSKLIWIQSITIICTTIGMEWVNSCLEDYTYITVRTIIIQIILFFSIFIFVRNNEDLVPYTIVSLISVVGSNIVNIFYINKQLRIRFVWEGIGEHIRPILLLFASTVASTIYVNSDTTMIGIICGDYNVGIYDASTKIYSIIQQVLSAAILVMLPRLSNYYAVGKIKEFKKLINNAFEFGISFSIPIAVGMLLEAKEIIYIFAGSGYMDSVSSLQILAVSLGVSFFGILFTNTILLPMKKELSVTVVMIIAAIVNIGLNLILIPIAQQNGAAITTVIAESIVMLVQLIIARRSIKIAISLRCILGTVCGSCAIIFICLVAKIIIYNLIIRLILSIIVSGMAYLVIQLVMKNNCIHEMVAKIIRRHK